MKSLSIETRNQSLQANMGQLDLLLNMTAIDAAQTKMVVERAV